MEILLKNIYYNDQTSLLETDIIDFFCLFGGVGRWFFALEIITSLFLLHS